MIEPALTRVAARVAHDLSNTVAVIATYAGLLRDDGSLSPQACADLDMVDEATRNIVELAQQLKTIAGRGARSRSECRIEDVARELEPAWRAQVGERLQIEFEGRLPAVTGGAERLTDILCRLLDNAAEATHDGEAIRIAGHADGSTVVLEIADEGCGMCAHDLARACEPFFTTKDRRKGLGLSIVCGQIQSLGGQIEIESETGRGTRCLLRIPVAVTAQPPARGQRCTSGRDRARILVIDDEPQIGRGFRRRFPDYEVVFAEGGHKGLALLQDDAGFDLILCDLGMPGMTGPVLYRELEKSLPEVLPRLVFCSGGVSDRAVREFLDGIENRLVEKPVSKGQIESLIADLNERT